MRTSDELREGFLSYFESKGHVRRPSASLVPAAYDPSVLLTTAGMQPLKPYFLGLETPPAERLTTARSGRPGIGADPAARAAFARTIWGIRLPRVPLPAARRTGHAIRRAAKHVAPITAKDAERNEREERGPRLKRRPKRAAC